MGANRLLIMDHEPEVRGFVGGVGKDLGFEVTDISDPDRFVGAVRKFSPSVIILDLQMPSHDGIEVLRSLSETQSSAKVLLTSGLDERVLTTAEQLGMAMGVDIEGSLSKPIPSDQLEAQLVRLRLEEKQLTSAELAEAIESGQLVVHFQPKAAMKSPGRWVMEGAEALVRW